MDPSTGIGFVPTQRSDTYELIDPAKSNFQGKYVLVSGASRGIGRAIAISYAKAGASGIAIMARSDLSTFADELVSVAKEAGRSPSPKVIVLKTDVTDRKSVEDAAERVKEEFGGKLDILINNAGYLESFVPMTEIDPDEWWKTWEINIKGNFLMNRAFVPVLLNANGDKTIVTVSSIGALMTDSGASAYQTTKTAVLRLTGFLMAEHGKQGLLAYSIHPGAVATELSSNMPKEKHSKLTDKPELAGDTVVFLTKEPREWLTDRYISVQWDMKELLEKKDEIVSKGLLQLKLRV